MFQFQLRRLLRGRIAKCASKSHPPSAASDISAKILSQQSRTPRSWFAAAGTGATTGAASVPPSPADLPDARFIPGSSSYGNIQYEAGTDAPYPIWMLDPQGAAYKSVLWVARNSSAVLDAVHDASGLPWWATILLCGAVTRLAILPFSFYSLRNVARVADAQADMRALMLGYRAAMSEPGMSAPSKARVTLVFARGISAALDKARCYPWRSFAIPLLQLPVVMAGVLGARHAVLLGDESFEREGMLWFTDLTVTDPTYGLPVLAVGLAYASLEVIFGTGQWSRTVYQGGASLLGARFGHSFKSGLQMLLLGSAPFVASLPAGLYVLMTANSAWTIAQVSTLRHPTVYRAITGRLPSAEIERLKQQQRQQPGDANRGSGDAGSSGGTPSTPSSTDGASASVPPASASSVATASLGSLRDAVRGAIARLFSSLSVSQAPTSLPADAPAAGSSAPPHRAPLGVVRDPAPAAVDDMLTRSTLAAINAAPRLVISRALTRDADESLPLSDFMRVSEAHLDRACRKMGHGMRNPLLLGHPQPFLLRMAGADPWASALRRAAPATPAAVRRQAVHEATEVVTSDGADARVARSARDVVLSNFSATDGSESATLRNSTHASPPVGFVTDARVVAPAGTPEDVASSLIVAEASIAAAQAAADAAHAAQAVADTAIAAAQVAVNTAETSVHAFVSASSSASDFTAIRDAATGDHQAAAAAVSAARAAKDIASAAIAVAARATDRASADVAAARAAAGFGAPAAGAKSLHAAQVAPVRSEESECAPSPPSASLDQETQEDYATAVSAQVAARWRSGVTLGFGRRMHDPLPPRANPDGFAAPVLAHPWRARAVRRPAPEALALRVETRGNGATMGTRLSKPRVALVQRSEEGLGGGRAQASWRRLWHALESMDGFAPVARLASAQHRGGAPSAGGGGGGAAGGGGASGGGGDDGKGGGGPPVAAAALRREAAGDGTAAGSEAPSEGPAAAPPEEPAPPVGEPAVAAGTEQPQPQEGPAAGAEEGAGLVEPTSPSHPQPQRQRGATLGSSSSSDGADASTPQDGAARAPRSRRAEKRRSVTPPSQFRVFGGATRTVSLRRPLSAAAREEEAQQKHASARGDDVLMQAMQEVSRAGRGELMLGGAGAEDSATPQQQQQVVERQPLPVPRVRLVRYWSRLMRQQAPAEARPEAAAAAAAPEGGSTAAAAGVAGRRPRFHSAYRRLPLPPLRSPLRPPSLTQPRTGQDLLGYALASELKRLVQGIGQPPAADGGASGGRAPRRRRPHQQQGRAGPAASADPSEGGGGPLGRHSRRWASSDVAAAATEAASAQTPVLGPFAARADSADAAAAKGNAPGLPEDLLRALMGEHYEAYAAAELRAAAAAAAAAEGGDAGVRVELVLKDGTIVPIVEAPDADQHTPTIVEASVESGALPSAGRSVMIEAEAVPATSVPAGPPRDAPVAPAPPRAREADAPQRKQQRHQQQRLSVVEGDAASVVAADASRAAVGLPDVDGVEALLRAEGFEPRTLPGLGARVYAVPVELLQRPGGVQRLLARIGDMTRAQLNGAQSRDAGGPQAAQRPEGPRPDVPAAPLASAAPAADAASAEAAAPAAGEEAAAPTAASAVDPRQAAKPLLGGIEFDLGYGRLIGHGVRRQDQHPHPHHHDAERDLGGLGSAAAAAGVAAGWEAWEAAGKAGATHAEKAAAAEAAALAAHREAEAREAQSATTTAASATAPQPGAAVRAAGETRAAAEHRRRLAAAQQFVDLLHTPRHVPLEAPQDAHAHPGLQESLRFRRLVDPPGTAAVFTGLVRSGLAPAAVPVPLHRAGEALADDDEEEGGPGGAAELLDILDNAQRVINARPVAAPPAAGRGPKSGGSDEGQGSR